MAITHTQTVTDLVVLNDGTDVVSEVEVEVVSVDDSNPTVLTTKTTERFFVDSSGGTSAAGFVAYASLTQANVLDWLTTQIAKSNIEKNAESWINSVKVPPTPAEVSKALPF
tara:strand:+ start:695 stop:1030 length:336 start_codon:yes stop_codon:yes gene_type:complete